MVNIYDIAALGDTYMQAERKTRSPCLAVDKGFAPSAYTESISFFTRSYDSVSLSRNQNRLARADAVVSAPATTANVPSAPTSPTDGLTFSSPASSDYKDVIKMKEFQNCDKWLTK